MTSGYDPSSKNGILVSGMISDMVALHPPDNTAILSPIYGYMKFFIFNVIFYIESLVVDNIDCITTP